VAWERTNSKHEIRNSKWFDRLTTLSEVEGESRKVAENQVILDPGSHPAARDLAGMTNWDQGVKEERCGGGCVNVVKYKPGDVGDLGKQKRGGSLGTTPLL
jgi:hypothetical protein